MRDQREIDLIEGSRTALAIVLRARGLGPSDETRLCISQCDDLSMLDRWLARASVAMTESEVFVDR